MSYYLSIIGSYDNPVYEVLLSSSRSSTAPASSSTAGEAFSLFSPSLSGGSPAYPAPSSTTAGGRHVLQLLTHAALDTLEDVAWVNGGMYLKQVERVQDWWVSAWITPGGVKVVLLHDVQAGEGVRLFLQEVWEGYVKTLLNPFHDPNTPIRSATFDARVKASAKKHL